MDELMLPSSLFPEIQYGFRKKKQPSGSNQLNNKVTEIKHFICLLCILLKHLEMTNSTLHKRHF